MEDPGRSPPGRAVGASGRRSFFPGNVLREEPRNPVHAETPETARSIHPRGSTSQKRFPEAPYKARAQGLAPIHMGPCRGLYSGWFASRHVSGASGRAVRPAPCAYPGSQPGRLDQSRAHSCAPRVPRPPRGWPRSPAAAGPETWLGPYAANPGCTPRARLSRAHVPPGWPRSGRSGLGPFLGAWPRAWRRPNCT